MRKYKYIIEDISGKVPLYDNALYNSICAQCPDVPVQLLMPGKGLLSLIPSFLKGLKGSENIVKRLIKVLEALINYLYTLIRVTVCRPQVLHLQWLPFIEFISGEEYVLKCLKRFSPETRIVLTIHNVYPHNMSDNAKKAYNNRFRNIIGLIDAFIVHTQITKEDVVREFDINFENVYVCCHGVFEPKIENIKVDRRVDGKLHILQFGGQSLYKGTDILVEAVCGLDKNRQAFIETHIVGSISQSFLDDLMKKDNDSIIQWKPCFLTDDELYQEINKSDIIVLPYRAISQSGVLLLSIYFEKLVICSDLPSFVETLRGGFDDMLDDCLFFKSENVQSLRDLLIRYIDNDIDEQAVCDRIHKLKNKYSWNTAAKETLKVYNNISKICN